jgi:ParB family transcriptional regulator, chromosome partitioning protein
MIVTPRPCITKENKPMSKRLRIPPKNLKFGKNMRTGELDQSLLRELGESMRVKQLQPIVTAPDYTVVIGNRRGMAAMLVGLEFVEVEVLDEMPTESTVELYQWGENFFRENVSDWDKVQTCFRLIQLMPTWDHKDVANFLRVDPSMIARLLCVGKASEAVRLALQTGKICLATCYEITKCKLDDQQAALDLAINGASRADVIEHRRSGNSRGNGSSVKSTRITISLPDGILVAISGPGLTTDGVVSSCATIHKEAKKAVEKNHNVKTLEAIMRDRLKGGA